MSKDSIPQAWNFLNPQQAAFAAMVEEMAVSETNNPRRYVGHPSGWRFVVEGNEDTGPLVLAASPGYSLSAACFLVDGPAAMRVMELLSLV